MYKMKKLLLIFHLFEEPYTPCCHVVPVFTITLLCEHFMFWRIAVHMRIYFEDIS